MNKQTGTDGKDGDRKRLHLGVMAPADRGSLGDQAMLEVVRDRFSGDPQIELTVLLRRTWTAPTFRGHCQTKKFVVTKNDTVTALQNTYLTMSFGSIWMIGADIIDGVYDENYVLQILHMMKHFGSKGLTTGVFGCSISPRPKQSIMDAIAANPDLTVLTRDPVSGARLEQAARRRGPAVADIAFMLEPKLTTAQSEAAQSWLRRQKAADHFVLAVNSSGHTASKGKEAAITAQIDAYRSWLRNNSRRSIIFFPHDTRPAPVGDFKIVSSLYDALRSEFSDRLWLLQPPINAWDIKALLCEVDGVFSGRMHAAIASLGAGVAPLCVVYQGKFEGLMQHFQLEGLCQTRDILQDGRMLREALEQYGKTINRQNAKVSEHLPAVMALSEKNFDFI